LDWKQRLRRFCEGIGIHIRIWQGIQVRGVVFDALDTYTLYCALVIETTARRLIKDEQLFLCWVESPGGDEFLPGGATLFEFWLMILMLFWVNVTNC